jgi:hypothetical protein
MNRENSYLSFLAKTQIENDFDMLINDKIKEFKKMKNGEYSVSFLRDEKVLSEAITPSFRFIWNNYTYYFFAHAS